MRARTHTQFSFPDKTCSKYLQLNFLISIEMLIFIKSKCFWCNWIYSTFGIQYRRYRVQFHWSFAFNFASIEIRFIFIGVCRQFSKLRFQHQYIYVYVLISVCTVCVFTSCWVIENRLHFIVSHRIALHGILDWCCAPQCRTSMYIVPLSYVRNNNVCAVNIFLST